MRQAALQSGGEATGTTVRTMDSSSTGGQLSNLQYDHGISQVQARHHVLIAKAVVHLGMRAIAS